MAELRMPELIDRLRESGGYSVRMCIDRHVSSAEALLRGVLMEYGKALESGRQAAWARAAHTAIVLLASQPTPKAPDAEEATHRCKICHARWRKLDAGAWKLLTAKCSNCPDDKPADGRAEEMTATTPT